VRAGTKAASGVKGAGVDGALSSGPTAAEQHDDTAEHGVTAEQDETAVCALAAAVRARLLNAGREAGERKRLGSPLV
jgi:hypothetical protein